MNNKTPAILFTLFMLILLVVTCQPKAALRQESTARESELPTQETAPSRTPLLSTSTRQIIFPTETRVLPTETPQPISQGNPVATPTRTVDRQPTPTMDRAEINAPALTFDNMLLSTVYFWSYKGPYTAFDLRGMRLIKLMGLNQDIYPNSPGRYPGSSHTLNLAFANYSPFVAYIRGLLEKNTPRELWIADLTPKNAQKVWVDENNWLGNIRSLRYDSDILWGPFDRYVLIWSYLPEHPERWWDVPEKPDHMVVYDNVKREAYEWRGNCNRLAKSPFSDRISVWCPLQSSDSGYTYAVLEPNGIFFTKYDPETTLADTLAWRFSPAGDRVLFLGEDLRWHYTDQNQQIRDIPVSYIENYRYPSPKAINFQWSQDSRRLLVFGKPDNPDQCPYTSLDPNKPEKRGCWFVIDTQTQEVVWSIEPSVITTVNLSVENASIDYNAALSPDGQFLILTITDFRLGYGNHLVITSLVTGESSEITLNPGLLPTYKVLWVKKLAK
jgi:hypothetical protein